MKIKRDYYLNKCIKKMNNSMIKIISGIRRCGKSYLLFILFKEYLLDNGVFQKNIIEIHLDRESDKKLRNPENLIKYVYDITRKNKEEKFFLFIDEIQLCENFVDVLNDFIYENNIDVYVTGSNSKFLAKDVVTEFRGRGDEIRLYPLSFNEFFQNYNENEYNKAINDYFMFGGMPYLNNLDNDKDKISYLNNLFLETYIKDIKERNKIRDTDAMNKLILVLASSIGSFVNPAKISKTFKSELKIDLSVKTINEYIHFLEDSFIIKISNRYDIKGKKYINTPYKCYFEDIGLRNAKLNLRQSERTHIMENLIFNELYIRGYSVDVGVVNINERQKDNSYINKNIECDFVINRGYEKYYVQSCYEIPVDEKRNQEIRPFLNIRDSFKKVIITFADVIPYIDDNGVFTISLKEFLLNNDILKEL